MCVWIFCVLGTVIGFYMYLSEPVSLTSTLSRLSLWDLLQRYQPAHSNATKRKGGGASFSLGYPFLNQISVLIDQQWFWTYNYKIFQELGTFRFLCERIFLFSGFISAKWNIIDFQNEVVFLEILCNQSTKGLAWIQTTTETSRHTYCYMFEVMFFCALLI